MSTWYEATFITSIIGVLYVLSSQIGIFIILKVQLPIQQIPLTTSLGNDGKDIMSPEASKALIYNGYIQRRPPW